MRGGSEPALESKARSTQSGVWLPQRTAVDRLFRLDVEVKESVLHPESCAVHGPFSMLLILGWEVENEICSV